MKLHTRFYVDPKVASLPDADTEMMFVRSLAYAGDQETGGFIPEASLPLLARRRRYAASVKALVASGLWTADAGGYRITRWDDRQEELETLAKRRAADRERKRRQRASQKESSSDDVSADASSDISADVQPLEEELDTDTYLQGGGNSRTAPADGPPPRRCPKHEHVVGFVTEPCGACAEARRAHDAWTPPDPQAQHQRALLAKAEEGNQRARELAETEPDRDAKAKVIQIREHHRLPGRSA